MVLVFFSLITSVFSQALDSPEALVLARAQLMSADCNMDCSRKVAGMYSQKSLGSSPNSAADVHILFGARHCS